jgi:hypothetical protein
LITSVRHKGADYKSDRAPKGRLRGDIKTAAHQWAAVFLCQNLRASLTLFRVSDIISIEFNKSEKPGSE